MVAALYESVGTSLYVHHWFPTFLNYRPLDGMRSSLRLHCTKFNICPILRRGSSFFRIQISIYKFCLIFFVFLAVFSQQFAFVFISFSSFIVVTGMEKISATLSIYNHFFYQVVFDFYELLAPSLLSFAPHWRRGGTGWKLLVCTICSLSSGEFLPALKLFSQYFGYCFSLYQPPIFLIDMFHPLCFFIVIRFIILFCRRSVSEN